MKGSGPCWSRAPAARSAKSPTRRWPPPTRWPRFGRQELERACAILRVGRLHLLGYRDSGMMGTPDNDRPSSFYQASLLEATARLVTLVRRERPQVLVTYDERGFYGHPDHIRAHQITVEAFD